jgi:hypothetical protein
MFLGIRYPDQMYGTALNVPCNASTINRGVKASDRAQDQIYRHQPEPAAPDSMEAPVPRAQVEPNRQSHSYGRQRSRNESTVLVPVLLVVVVVLAFMFARLAVYRFLFWVATLWLIAGVLSLLIPLRPLGIKNRLAALVVVIVSFVLIGLVNNPLEKDRQANAAMEKAQAEEARVAAKRKAEDVFIAMSPAAHLMVARSELNRDSKEDQIQDAFQHLRAIPNSAPESRQAATVKEDFLRLQQEGDQAKAGSILLQAEAALAAGKTDEATNLMNQAEKITHLGPAAQTRIAKLVSRIDFANTQRAKKEAILENELQKSLREAWVKSTQEQLWREGLEMTLQARGSTLYVKYILAGDAFAFQFSEKLIQPNLPMLRNVGFTRVVLDNGDTLRTWKLE